MIDTLCGPVLSTCSNWTKCSFTEGTKQRKKSPVYLNVKNQEETKLPGPLAATPIPEEGYSLGCFSSEGMCHASKYSINKSYSHSSFPETSESRGPGFHITWMEWQPQRSSLQSEHSCHPSTTLSVSADAVLPGTEEGKVSWAYPLFRP